MSTQNTAVFKGQEFWSGAFDLADGKIREVHTGEEADNADYNTCFYFSAKTERLMFPPRFSNKPKDEPKRELGFFWVDERDGKINFHEPDDAKWREAIAAQISILPIKPAS